VPWLIAIYKATRDPLQLDPTTKRCGESLDGFGETYSQMLARLSSPTSVAAMITTALMDICKRAAIESR